MRKTYCIISSVIISMLFILNSTDGLADATRTRTEVRGYWRFEFKQTVGQVERIGDTSIKEIIRGDSYSFKRFETFKSIEEVPSGKFSNAEKTGITPPKIKTTTLKFISRLLWQITLEFDPTDYETYKKIIVLEYGPPNRTEKLNLRSTLQRGDKWIRLEGGCIFLRQLKRRDGTSVGSLEIRIKEKCGE